VSQDHQERRLNSGVLLAVDGLKRGLKQTARIVDEAIAMIDQRLEENEEERKRLLAKRQTFCDHRSILRREASDLGEHH
jgi:hypothetical protein